MSFLASFLATPGGGALAAEFIRSGVVQNVIRHATGAAKQLVTLVGNDDDAVLDRSSATQIYHALASLNAALAMMGAETIYPDADSLVGQKRGVVRRQIVSTIARMQTGSKQFVRKVEAARQQVLMNPASTALADIGAAAAQSVSNAGHVTIMQDIMKPLSAAASAEAPPETNEVNRLRGPADKAKIQRFIDVLTNNADVQLAAGVNRVTEVVLVAEMLAPVVSDDSYPGLESDTFAAGYDQTAYDLLAAQESDPSAVKFIGSTKRNFIGEHVHAGAASFLGKQMKQGMIVYGLSKLTRTKQTDVQLCGDMEVSFSVALTDFTAMAIVANTTECLIVECLHPGEMGDAAATFGSGIDFSRLEVRRIGKGSTILDASGGIGSAHVADAAPSARYLLRTRISATCPATKTPVWLIFPNVSQMTPSINTAGTISVRSLSAGVAFSVEMDIRRMYSRTWPVWIASPKPRGRANLVQYVSDGANGQLSAPVKTDEGRYEWQEITKIADVVGKLNKDGQAFSVTDNSITTDVGVASLDAAMELAKVDLNTWTRFRAAFERDGRVSLPRTARQFVYGKAEYMMGGSKVTAQNVIEMMQTFNMNALWTSTA